MQLYDWMSNTILFYKYQGTGNDFIMIDDREKHFQAERDLVHQLCHRRFGIGADGLILLQNDSDTDFRMVYYNADGQESTMCGNGGRCLVAFAKYLGLFEEKCRFIAVDGVHKAELRGGQVRLKMVDVSEVSRTGEDFVLNTGSPHYVRFVADAEAENVYQHGREIRNSAAYQADGINVNFVQRTGDLALFVRTYERGVEDETLSCGTGVTAGALALATRENLNQFTIDIRTLGGKLQVSAEKTPRGFTDIWLSGPATQVFCGEINLSTI